MDSQKFLQSVLFLIQKASTSLPFDIVSALEKAKEKEEKNSAAEFALDVIQKNISGAKEKNTPLCQDTGFPTFFVKYNPEEISSEILAREIKFAVEKATKKGLLRPNSVCPLTGKNTGNNLGEGFPKIIFSPNVHSHTTKIDLVLKGGGSENVSAQLSLPTQTDFGRANRDTEGVKKAVLQIIKNAEGKGCAPGILGIHIGGDRASGYEYAKKNLLRKIGERSENEILKNLEQEIVSQGNNLEIGPMGFGGKTTILEAFCSTSARVPASYFVTVSYGCWAMRRGFVELDESGEIQNHSFEDFDIKLEENSALLSKAKKINLPSDAKKISELKTGDMVLLSGKIFTARDAIHHMVVEEEKDLGMDISGCGLYHCGPVAIKKDDRWTILSAGPTTSIREEVYQAEFLEKTGVKAVIGKGGMGEKTLKALQDNKAVYLHAIGGAAEVYAQTIKQVEGVEFLDEFGVPEAMWKLEVENFPCLVTMDSFGSSLH